MGLSYSQGIGTTPLLGETIGANFDRAVPPIPSATRWCRATRACG